MVSRFFDENCLQKIVSRNQLYLKILVRRWKNPYILLDIIQLSKTNGGKIK